MERPEAYYVLSSHWDREWYLGFQQFRYQLVELLDAVLAGLDEGRLRGPFTLDGQAIMLEDYLEIRPERREAIARHLTAGGLVAGPWYVLPDELIVSGEALVRNLRLGRELTRELGGPPSGAGFLCDLFGHTSQMPQILAGFGITGGFLWRGVNTPETRVLRWRGADGSELLCHRFGRNGYWGFPIHVRGHVRRGQPATPAEQLAALDAFVAAEVGATPAGPILLFDGADHALWDEPFYATLAARLDSPDAPYRLRHASLDAYLDALREDVGRVTRTVEGELWEPGRLPFEEDQQLLLGGTLASRVWIKQENARCQSLLTQQAEPLATLAHAALGTPYPQRFLDIAWRWLLQNHPHDSICGCSRDLVHEDMRYRFRQCAEIAARLADEAARRLAAAAGPLDEGSLRVAVFNPLPRAVRQVVDLVLPLPEGWPVTALQTDSREEALHSLRLYDASGRELPYQRLAVAPRRRKARLHPTRAPQRYRADELRIAVALELPPLGMAVLTARPGAAGRPTRQPATAALCSAERSLENEHLRAQVEPDGTLTLTDKRSGERYAGLLAYEEGADIGSGYGYAAPTNDEVQLVGAGSAGVAIRHNGPLCGTLALRTRLDVPACFDFPRMARADERVPLQIETLVTLRAGAEHLEIETALVNTADDHRLRVLFPSGARAETSLSDAAFDVVERAVALPPDNHTYREPAAETRPQQSWTAVWDGGRGLAVITEGLQEVAVRDLPERPIALTLLRATGHTVMGDDEPGGQLRGPLRLRYRLAPLAAPPDRRALCELGSLTVAGFHTVTLATPDVERLGAPAAPQPDGLLALDGPAVLSSVRLVDGAPEARLFNPEPAPIVACLQLPGWPGARHAQPVDLESRPAGEPFPVVDGTIELRLGPKQIVTLRIL